ncbi:hypothetical protein QL285_009806 [Trifolium repens]|nr:hypothetical protein QL285_009806 [Trifolium repens]
MTMSQPSTQTSPTKTSPQKSSPSKTTTTTPNTIENPSVSLPQPSDIITNVVPITMVHPSFASILNPKPSNPSPSPKPKTTKKTKPTTTKKPKSQKSKSRYSSNFDMQKLYLEDLGNASTNVASDVATPCPDVRIETNKEVSPQTLSDQKGETNVLIERDVPNTPIDEGVDEDAHNIKIAEDVLKSLVDSVSRDKVVPDAPTSLAQDQPQDANEDDVVADSPVQQGKEVYVNVNTDNAMSVEDNIDYVTADEVVDENTDKGISSEEDLVIVKTVGDSKKKSGKTGVGKRLRERKNARGCC